MSNETEGLYGLPKVKDGWQEERTMEHASGIWGRGPMLRFLKHWNQFKPGDVVVDFAAGAGYPTLQVAQIIDPTGTDTEGLVLGVEKSKAMLGRDEGQNPEDDITIKYAAQKNLKFIQGDITDVQLPNEIADGVVSFMVLHNLTLPEVQECFKEASRILKPGGKAIFLTMHPDALEGNWDLDFMNYNPDDLQRYRDAVDKEGVVLRGKAKNAGGGEKDVILIHHTDENMRAAWAHAGLESILIDSFDVDAETAVEKFGQDAVRRISTTPMFQMMVLKKPSK